MVQSASGGHWTIKQRHSPCYRVENEVTGKRWHPVPVPGRTFSALLNEEFLRLEAKYSEILPDLRDAETLLLASDYSGGPREAAYSVFSFLLTSLDSWARWEPARARIRSVHLAQSRRMSFKRLGDGQRKRALLPLLSAANLLDGLSFSIAFSRRCESVFAGLPPLDLGNPEFAAFRKWKPLVLEKAFFVLHVLCVLLGGLASPGQNVLWFTDEDEIAANDQRVRELTQLFGWISSQYLDFMLGHCRVGTTRCDDGSRQIEDFAAIPDLVAGAVAEQFALKGRDASKPDQVFWMYRPDFSRKTRDITWWFSDSSQPLKRLLCAVDPSPDGKGHTVSWFHFWDQTG